MKKGKQIDKEDKEDLDDWCIKCGKIVDIITLNECDVSYLLE